MYFEKSRRLNVLWTIWNFSMVSAEKVPGSLDFCHHRGMDFTGSSTVCKSNDLTGAPNDGPKCIENTGSPSSKYEHRRASALLRNIQNIRICMGKKPIVFSLGASPMLDVKLQLFSLQWFRVLGASFSIGASFSRFRCFVFEFWVLRASVFVFETTPLEPRVTQRANDVRGTNLHFFFLAKDRQT